MLTDFFKYLIRLLSHFATEVKRTHCLLQLYEGLVYVENKVHRYQSFFLIVSKLLPYFFADFSLAS